MSASRQLPPDLPANMTVAEFLEWCPDDGRHWELVDGEPRAMASSKMGHGGLQSEVGRLIGNHLVERGGRCTLVTAPGIVPRMRASFNIRVPDLAITRSPYTVTDADMPDPVLVIEILSPSNQADTWRNVWAYATIPSVREILVLRTVTMRADLLRRGEDGNWPQSPEVVTEGDLVLDSIGFRVPLAALYRTAGLPANG